MKKYLFLFAIVFAVFVFYSDVKAATSCVALVNPLSYASTDLKTNNEVTTLQTFLRTNNYLSNSPSGYFGPLTVAAVKKFQIANGISDTGSVGPLTRAKINVVSCGNPSTSNGIQLPMTPTTVTATTSASVSNSNTDGCSNGAVFSSTTGFACRATTVSATTVPHIDMVSAPAADNFEVVSNIKAFITGEFLASNDLNSVSVYVNNIQATITQADYGLIIATMPTLTPGMYNLYVKNEKGVSNLVQVKVVGPFKNTSVMTPDYSLNKTLGQNGCASGAVYSATTGFPCTSSTIQIPVSVPVEVINNNSIGYQVTILQKFLSAKGFLATPAGFTYGLMDQSTKDALASYIAKVGISPGDEIYSTLAQIKEITANAQ